MTYTLTIARNVGRVAVERLRVTLRAPDESTARVLASRLHSHRWRVIDCVEGTAVDALEVTP